MVQGYYTLQEAARFLETSVDELKKMAQKGEIRSFQDRGTLRFRIQDIQELARLRGATSDPELLLGDASLPPGPIPTPPPSSGSRKAQPSGKTSLKQDAPEVFDFDFDNENVNVGADILGPPSSSKSRPGSKSGKKATTPHTPPVGSDSDVRLVADGSDVSFTISRDSDVKRGDTSLKGPADAVSPKPGAQASSGGKKSSHVSLGSGVQQPPKTGLSGKQASPRPGSAPQPIDSGVRLVPMDDDSIVKLLGGSDEVSLGEQQPPSMRGDSNVRLERVRVSRLGDSNMQMTEEINLDEELRKQEEREKNKAPAKVKPKSELKFPTASPFELSESEMKMPSELLDDSGPKTPMRLRKGDSDSSDFDLVTPAHDQDSSDFDLQTSGESSSSPVEDSDFSLEVPDDQQHVMQEESSGELTGSKSGISLENPADEGISLEVANADTQADEEIDFDLSLEVEDTPKSLHSRPVADSSSDFDLKIGDTPRPVRSQPVADSDSEFELSLDSSPAELGTQELPDSDSDINLSLEVDPDQASGKAVGEDEDSFEVNLGSEEAKPSKSDSDSEFELTLDDSGNLASLDDSAPQVKSKAVGSDEEQDIFETDFEVPALDESDDGAVADSELESSDFDLALDDSELAAEEESGSQVVALDEEDTEALVDSDSDTAVVDDVEVEEDSSEFGDLDADVQVDADDEGVAASRGELRTVTKVKLVPPAPWGVMPVVFMLPCVVIMFLVGILGYEMVQSTTGVRAPGPLTLAIADMIGHKITLKQ